MSQKYKILNLGGEGELPEAVDLNSLIATLLPPAEFIRPGRFIKHDMLHAPWPIDDSTLEEVVGNNLPGFSAHERLTILHEVLRVLKPEGLARMHSMSLAPNDWLASIRKAGLTALGYAQSYGVYHAVGKKP